MGKIKLTICGKEYQLNIDGDGTSLRRHAVIVEKNIFEFMETSHISMQNAAVLTALDAYEEAEKHSKSIDNIRFQIKGYMDELAKVRSDFEESQKRGEKLSKKNFELTKKYADADKQYEEYKKQIQEKDDKIEELLSQNEKLKIRVSEFEIEKDTLKKELTVTKNAAEPKNKGDKKDYINEIKDLQKKLSEKDKQIADINELLDDKDKKAEKLGAVVEELRKENRELWELKV
ncbi:MAG: cell division protein ZapA [Ruminococcus sp.]|jgi:chromosome segregation ATPase|nr:cell division protein ZapA [Ruminococcus sp.]